jgi:hypothetical protein
MKVLKEIPKFILQSIIILIGLWGAFCSVVFFVIIFWYLLSFTSIIDVYNGPSGQEFASYFFMGAFSFLLFFVFSFIYNEIYKK